MLYIVNKHTKEHRRYMDAEEWADADCVVVGADPEGWIPWHGGECPLPDNEEVQICTKVGIKNIGVGGDFRWNKQHRGGDIVAYRPILDAKPEPAWSGEGLPPVGCECEYRLPGGWEAAKVIGYDGPACVVAVDGEGYFGNATPGAIRPIRSEEDRAVDEMMDVSERSAPAEKLCRALYRAGYRKTGGE